MRYFFLFFILAFSIFSSSVMADTMTSPFYRVEFGNINIGGKDGSSDNYDLSTSLGQTAAKEFSSTGYIVKAGFQYFHSIIPFYFSVSNITVNFGTVIPQVSSTQTITLTAKFGDAGQYQVTTTEKTPMTNSAGATTIPDTSCDGGVETCTETSAKSWTSSSKYGFGYNMSGDDVPADFTSSNHYRPFPSLASSESPAVVMSSTNVTSSSVASMKFKLNVAPDQADGTYRTIINFTATPSI